MLLYRTTSKEFDQISGRYIKVYGPWHPDKAFIENCISSLFGAHHKVSIESIPYSDTPSYSQYSAENDSSKAMDAHLDDLMASIGLL